MNTIEQTVEPKNGAIDLHVSVPAEWEGYMLKVTVERTEARVDKPKIDLTQFGGKWAHLPMEERLKMQQQLDDIRNEWDRPTF